MKTLRMLLIGLALTFVAGCFTQEREQISFDKLKSGMSESDLKHILGSPVRVEKTDDYDVWTYPDGVVFVKEGKIFSWKEGS